MTTADFNQPQPFLLFGKLPVAGSSETLFRLLTARSPAAIAVIQIYGPETRSIVDSFWKPATNRRDVVVDSIRYGAWISGRVDTDIGCNAGPSEDVVLCWTAEDCVEVHCHGGPIAANRILADLAACGASQQDTRQVCQDNITQQWTEEAWEDLAFATTELTTAILLEQARGTLENEVNRLVENIRSGQVHAATLQSEQLLSRSLYGTRLLSGWKIAIVGPPNAGKSSLLNRTLGYTRAIVHDMPGTTRDILREQTSILGWPVTFIDTAGLRETECEIEAEGARRASQVLNDCDLILLLVEPIQGVVEIHRKIAADYHAKVLVVVTKADLLHDNHRVITIENELKPVTSASSVSSTSNFGIDDLFQAIVKRLIPDRVTPGLAVPFRQSQVTLIQKLKQNIASD